MDTIRGGKIFIISKHAFDAMNAERPPIRLNEVRDALEAPDADDGRRATRRAGGRTVFVHYKESEDEVNVKSVSATKGRLAP